LAGKKLPSHTQGVMAPPVQQYCGAAALEFLDTLPDPAGVFELADVIAGEVPSHLCSVASAVTETPARH